jgi:type IV secretory pathway VirD2 relaxase
MTVQQAIQSRLLTRSATDPSEVAVRLPLKLKVERDPVRLKMMRRLASSRMFALGNRSGVLRAAQNRSGRAFRLDVRQRVIVKALVSRHMGKGAERGAALAAHVSYLGRAGAGGDGARPEFFDRDQDGVQAAAETKDWSDDRHHFRFIISPEHGDRIDDLPGYVREVMARVSADRGEPQLTWVATCHYDTDQPHAHVLVRGRRGDGRDLVIPRDYIAYGMRARAQEAAQERLGDLSRVDAEKRVWRETAADRFTALDRRLLAAAEPGGLVDDGVGRNDAWNALTRGRLRHLEGLGLAIRAGRRYRLEPDIETKLRTLQARRDIIRTLNQRRLEVDREVRPMGPAPVRGQVVKTGFHDELGAAPYVIVRDRDGVEHYARLRAGPRLELGRTVLLAPTGAGLAQVLGRRGTDLVR